MPFFSTYILTMAKFIFGFLTGVLVSILAIFLFGYFMAEDFMNDSEELDSPALILDSANQNKSVLSMSLIDLKTGNLLDTNALKNRVIVLNFWERWCIPCQQELPSLERLNSIVKDTSILICIISTQNQEKTAEEKVVREFSMPFYHLKGILPIPFTDDRVPRTYIINKSGGIVVSSIGASRWDDSTVVKLLDSLKKIN
jgi:thiol-disulfide isomerase/thioredoxin